MPARRISSAFCAAGLLFMTACGGSQAPSGSDLIKQCLPKELTPLGLAREGGILHFAGDSLFNYINGAAEMYHKYDFEEVHVGKYRKHDGEVTVDIYRFASPDRAFGMYTTLRPDDPDTVHLGVEGFTYGPAILYARGPYMVNVQTYDEGAFSPSELKAVAQAVEKHLPGTTEMPAAFGLFPETGRLRRTEKIFADAFLGHDFLSNVYTVDHELLTRRVTLFLTTDLTGNKFRQWAEEAKPENLDMEALSSLPYDEGQAAVLSERYYGIVAAGRKGGWLSGMVGYEDVHSSFLGDWLKTLPPASRQ
jgi:hypothetical protein